MEIRLKKYKGVQPQTFAWALLPTGERKNRIELFKFRSDAARAAKRLKLAETAVIAVVVETCKQTEEHFPG